MSRITGTDAANLIEAYNAVYAPQEEVELTEEQVQEDFENWVNSLVEEGHDLSEYTWEDMYEEYLNEMGQRMTTGQATAPRAATSPKPAPAAPYRPAGGGMGGMRGSGRDRTSYQTSSSPGALRVQPTNAPYQSRFAGARDAAFARARQIQGSPVVGPRVSAPAPARPAPAPAAAPTRPATTTSSKPAPAPAPTPTSTTAPAAPARPSLRSDIADLQKMRLASQERQRKGGATVIGSQMASFDMFDVVKGYLIDEGYAETEEAALVIMANMSEEWKTQILESGYFPTKESQKEDEKKYKMGGASVKHRNLATQSPKPSR